MLPPDAVHVVALPPTSGITRLVLNASTVSTPGHEAWARSPPGNETGPGSTTTRAHPEVPAVPARAHTWYWPGIVAV